MIAPCLLISINDTQRKEVLRLASNSPHLTLMTIVAETAFVSVLAILSDQSPGLETIVVTFLIGLWLVFLINQGPQLFAAMKWKN